MTGSDEEDEDDLNVQLYKKWAIAPEDSSAELVTDAPHRTRSKEDLPDIADILHDGETLYRPTKGSIQTWLGLLYNNSRGFELGTFGPGLLATTMKAQTSKWEAICLGYISDVVVITHTYIVQALKHKCPDPRIRAELMSTMMDRIMEGYAKAIEQVKFVLHVERSKTPTTQNHYFNDILQKS